MSTRSYLEEVEPGIKIDGYEDTDGQWKETKQLEFWVGWDGNDGCVSVDTMLILLQQHFPDTPRSLISITIKGEDTIVVFDKRTVPT